MASVGLRELKQNPSEVVARAERGETIVITVQGRPVAQMIPLAPARQRWVSAEVLSNALAGFEPDPEWAAQIYAFGNNDPLVDPWERAGL